MANVSRYKGLRDAYEAALRQNELYHAMVIVEQCGASPELTEAITRLGARLEEHERQLKQMTRDGISVSGYPWSQE